MSDTSDTLSLDEYVTLLHEDVESFKTFVHKQHEKVSGNPPLIMALCRWDAKFDRYLRISVVEQSR